MSSTAVSLIDFLAARAPNSAVRREILRACEGPTGPKPLMLLLVGRATISEVRTALHGAAPGVKVSDINDDPHTGIYIHQVDHPDFALTGCVAVTLRSDGNIDFEFIRWSGKRFDAHHFLAERSVRFLEDWRRQRREQGLDP